jgi:hypothetical protein
MSAAALPFADLYPVVADYQIDFPVQRHRSRHIGEKVL